MYCEAGTYEHTVAGAFVEEQYLKASFEFAIRALDWKEEGRLAAVYETITGRVPDAQEFEILQKALNDFEVLYRSHPELTAAFVNQELDGTHQPQVIAAWAMIINTIYNLDITKTRS